MIFIKTLQKMLKLDFILKIMNQIEHCLQEKKFVGLRAKSYSYLVNDGSEDEKVKSTKTCVIKNP